MEKKFEIYPLLFPSFITSNSPVLHCVSRLKAHSSILYVYVYCACGACMCLYVIKDMNRRRCYVIKLNFEKIEMCFWDKMSQQLLLLVSSVHFIE